jgi:MFS family permease
MVGPKVSAWAPMAIPAFRVLWFAQLGSNIGTWMQTVGAQWYLVDAAAGATVIALVQTASLAPAMLFSLPAGVLADSFDRRKLLIWGIGASAVVAVALTVVAAANALTPWTLLAFTFLLGVTAALTSPAWQAIQPELVPREQIGASSALGGVTVNGARAVGPALAGLVLSVSGAPVVFGINAISFVAAVLALLWWKRPPQADLNDREQFNPALLAGVRYVASAGLIRRILLRAALFALPASALWALLPVTAQRLGVDSGGYGLLLGALGLGAVAGIFVLPLARRRFSDNVVIAVSPVLFAVGTLAAAYLPFVPALLLLILSGVAWIGTLTVLNAALQLTLPQWVRSRGASVYILVFHGNDGDRFVPLGHRRPARRIDRRPRGVGGAPGAGVAEHARAPAFARHGDDRPHDQPHLGDADPDLRTKADRWAGARDRRIHGAPRRAHRLPGLDARRGEVPSSHGRLPVAPLPERGRPRCDAGVVRGAVLGGVPPSADAAAHRRRP